MTVKQLKEQIANLPDDMPVVLDTQDGFTNTFDELDLEWAWDGEGILDPLERGNRPMCCILTAGEE